jgi:hypothetical protein
MSRLSRGNIREGRRGCIADIKKNQEIAEKAKQIRDQ